LLLGFASFEAHVNVIADDFLTREDLTVHERALLAEHAVELENGQFVERNKLKIQRLEDRVLFLCRQYSSSPIDRSEAYWSEFIEAAQIRNRLTHPKADPPKIDSARVTRALKAILELLNVVYRKLYKKKFPAYGRRLSSKLSF
jgi:hypothetical protein